MKIFAVQAKPLTGDLAHNFGQINKYYDQALEQQLDICFFPELITTGYFAEDLFLKISFIKEVEDRIQALIPKIRETALLLSTPTMIDGQLYNGVLAIQNGQIIGRTLKKHLPNYRLFDEKRYFSSGEPELIKINGVNIGVPICEDIWFSDVCLKLKSMGAEFLLVPNGSPYEKGKFDVRLSMVTQRFEEVNIPIIYLNQVLGQDGIIFDGRSFAFDGQMKYLFETFEEEAKVMEISGGVITQDKGIDHVKLPYEDEIYGAMVFGLREYLDHNNMHSIVIGLSGGIDSALVAAIAVDAIGAENVRVVMLPSRYTSSESYEDAEAIAEMLNINYEIIKIDDIVKATKDSIGQISDLAYENLQARTRGLILMAISNSNGSLLITTGNKSENATGYATLYGDMCGAFNPVKDLYKSELFKIAKFRNSHVPKSIKVKHQSYPIMPERVITKPPSAELRDNQKDSDSLPEYELLDSILSLYIEQDLGVNEIISLGFDEVTVKKVVKLVKISEFKRRQSAPGVKLSSRNLERDRRYPITNGYL